MKWHVVCRDPDCSEFDSFWDTKEDAEKRIEELEVVEPSTWRVVAVKEKDD